MSAEVKSVSAEVNHRILTGLMAFPIESVSAEVTPGSTSVLLG